MRNKGILWQWVQEFIKQKFCCEGKVILWVDMAAESISLSTELSVMNTRERRLGAEVIKWFRICQKTQITYYSSLTPVFLRTSLKDLRVHIPPVSGCANVWQGCQGRNFFKTRLQRPKSLLFIKTEIWYISNSCFVWFIWLHLIYHLHLHSFLSLIILTSFFGSRLGCNLGGLVHKELWFVL